MLLRALALTLLITAACRDREERPPPPPEPPPEPIRVAAGDRDLRVLLAEVAEGRGCELLKGKFRPLRDRSRSDVVTGVLWIRDCRMDRRGLDLTLALDAGGWQHIERATDTAGATFELAQSVRFAADMTMTGVLDVAYEPATHVASVWFSPAETPDVRFEPIGEIEVDERGAWAATVGALGSLVGQSPEAKSEDRVEEEGEHAMTKQLAGGLGATIDLCSGLVRDDLGRPPNGVMYEPGVGATLHVLHELHPGGLFVLGPYRAPKGMTVNLEVEHGTVRAALMCRGEAEKLGEAFLERRELPEVTSLAVKDTDGEATLRVGRSRCPVALVVRAVPDARTT
ncbi:MAG: hypothetical protein K8M05_03430, partial [Deltaproteobacteria bacterium]|nr:hypothetical protein [Kofleriaceae bacterium]